ncbi:type II secretion system F family protein [Luteitalea sp.]|jgi:tight adherence protein B|uniref:type II secretion system F family protein n=1 Tax=Luteitalea sp. TaxID=2004800 RepID=UPI0025B7C9A7|nr:type II secretion system F family protein [Luteitalea sp.]
MTPTMLLLKVVGLGVLFVAAVLFVAGGGESVGAWWRKRTRTYGSWIVDEFDAMFEAITIERAQNFITGMTVGGALIGFLLGSALASRVFFALFLAGMGYFIPRVFVLWRRHQRLDRIDDQLVDALRLMSNGLKAGLSLQQALELAVRETKPPIADELARVVKEIHLGRLMDDALRRFAERVPLEDVRIVVDSILTLRETGGNLSETFDVVANTIVERKKVSGKIKSMTAQGMTQGFIMCLMPPGMLLLFSFIDPTYTAPLFNTILGWVILAIITALDLMGLWAMLKLVKIDV